MNTMSVCMDTTSVCVDMKCCLVLLVFNSKVCELHALVCALTKDMLNGLFQLLTYFGIRGSFLGSGPFKNKDLPFVVHFPKGELLACRR